MRQVPWNKTVLEKFIEYGLLNELEEQVIRTRVAKSWTRTKQCRELNLSMSSLDRIIRRLKDRYDEVQSQYPDELPQRRHSDYEDYLDSN